MIDDILLWAMQQEDLERWGIPISDTYKKALTNDIPLTLHTLATSALLILAIERMEETKASSLRILSHAL